MDMYFCLWCHVVTYPWICVFVSYVMLLFILGYNQPPPPGGYVQNQPMQGYGQPQPAYGQPQAAYGQPLAVQPGYAAPGKYTVK